MKTYIYILFLLAALVQPLLAQDAPVTKTQPPFPSLPYKVTYTAAPTGGEVVLSVFGIPDSIQVAPGTPLPPGEEVTLKATPSPDHQVVFGYPKVYCTNTPSTVLLLTPVAGNPGKYTFAMPEEPVTVEVKFQAKPATLSSDARLKTLEYNAGVKWIPVPGFTAGKKQYVVPLRTTTNDAERVTLRGIPAHPGAKAPKSQIVLSSGNGNAPLSVTAEDGTIETYEVVFRKAQPQTYIITIESVEGGTLSATDSTGKVIRSGDVVAKNMVLTLRNTPVAGYTFSRYTVDSREYTDTTLTVISHFTISGKFNAPSAPLREEDLGEPALAESEAAGSSVDAPQVIIPNSGSLPEDTELSQLRLVKTDIEDAKEAEAMEDAKKAAANAGVTLTGTNMAVIELTLVKVTSVYDRNHDEFKTSVVPVQPADQMRVRIPYQTGFDTNRENLVIIHLRSDGSQEIYSREKGNLILASDYMEIIVTGFSPFIVTYAHPSSTDPDPGPSPDPGPTPDPDPTYYTVTLPAVEGATTDPAPGNYEVEVWDVFTFYLTLDKDYDQSVPVVTTDRNETIKPRTSDGAYIITYVRQPITILIAGIKKNTDVANETIASGLKIWTEPSALCLDTDRTEEVRIITVAGSTVAAFTTQPGLNRRPLAPGLYIVQTARKVSKVIVR